MTEHDRRLYRALNACIRFIFNVRADEHITLYYERLHWLKVDQRRNYFVECQLFNTLRSKQPDFLYSNLSYRIPVSERQTRAAIDTLIQPQCRTELFKRSFRIVSIRLWNCLPLSVREATSLTVFKQKLYAHLLEQSSFLTCLLINA